MKKLWSLSCNMCAFPGCKQRLIDEKDNIIGVVCHIEAANEGGPRYNSLQDDEERRSFENLILFCPTHHTITDDESEYTTEKLKKIKITHENNCKDKPFGLSQEQLEKIMKKEEFFTQQNILLGPGQQISAQKSNITINTGLSIEQALQLFHALIGDSFPQ